MTMSNVQKARREQGQRSVLEIIGIIGRHRFKSRGVQRMKEQKEHKKTRD